MDTEFRVFVNGVDKGNFRTIQISDHWGLTIPIGPANTAYKIEVNVDGEKVGEYNVICPSPKVGQSQTSEQSSSSTVPESNENDDASAEAANSASVQGIKQSADGTVLIDF